MKTHKKVFVFKFEETEIGLLGQRKSKWTRVKDIQYLDNTEYILYTYKEVEKSLEINIS